MGQNESTFRKTYADTVSELSSVQLSEIHARFGELYSEAGGSKGVVVDREAFSKYLNLPVTVGDRLFDAFDKKKNGSICMEEFVCGLAIVLHGSFKDRCTLLFSVFNLGNDEGVSREELRTMLTAIMQSTNTILYSVGDQDSAVMGSEDIQTTVDTMVQTAFTNCDISRTGKLLPMEFEYWLKRNPKVLDTLLSFQTRIEECTLGKLIMSPSEQVLAGMTTSTSSLSSQQGSLSSPTASPSQQQKRRSPFSIRRQSKTGKEPHSPASSVTSKMFQVGSVDSINTPESGMGSVSSNVLQSVSMDTESGGMATQQDSLTSVESGLQLGVNTRSGEGSLTRADVDAIPRVPPTSTDVSLSDHQGDHQLTGLVEAGNSIEGLGLPMGGSDVTPPTEGVATDAGENKETDLPLAGIPGEGEREAWLLSGNDAGTSDQVVLDFDGVVGTGSSHQQDHGEQSCSLETTGGYGGGVVYEGVDMGGGAGSIMNADSALALDMDGVLQEQASESSPLSPILPTTALEVGVEEVEQGAEFPAPLVNVQEMGVAGESGEKPAQEGVAPVILSHQNSAQDNSVRKPQPTLSQLDEPLLKAPVGVALRERVGRTSPLVDEWEGQEVREDVHEAWVLSADTRSLLQDNTDSASPTCPALMADIKLSDAISDLLRQHYPDRHRMQLLTMDQVSMDTAGLRRLVSSGSLFSALEMTAHFLSAHGQGLGQVGQPTIHTHKTLQMWSARISLLLFLKLYNEAERELDAFGEMTNPDLYYEYHGKAYPERKGSMVPFTLRLMHANLPRHTGKVQLALDRLCTLQHTCQQILTVIQVNKCLPGHKEQLCEADVQVAAKVWSERLSRVKCCLANTLVHLQDYAAAAKIYNELARQGEENKCDILSLIGRLYLQLGDLKTAQGYFEKVKVHLGDKADSSSLVHLNNGFVSVCLSQWQTAMDHFNSALALDPGDISIQSNVTVCKFYMGQLKESITDMECLLTLSPPTSLQPAVFANLANSYELESGDSFNKKISFLPLLGQHVGQGYQHLPLLSLKS